MDDRQSLQSATSDRTEPSRRLVIKAGLGALAAFGVSALAPSTALAATGGSLIMGHSDNDAGSDSTQMTSATTSWTLRLMNTGTGGTVLGADQLVASTHAALQVTHPGTGNAIRSTAYGAAGEAFWGVTSSADNSSPTIYGLAKGNNGQAMLGVAESVYPNARGLKGELTAAAAAGCAIEGKTQGSAGATGVWGQVTAGGNGYGVKATNSGTGGALRAEILNAANASAAVTAATNGAGYAVRAEGGKAQLYVKPGVSSGAPRSGAHAVGEHFTDKSGREYVCTTAGTPGSWQPMLRGGTNTAELTVKSYSASVPAVRAQAASATGTALRVEGKVSMNRSGRAKIAKGKSVASVTVPGGLTAASNIICTSQNDGGSGVYIRYAKRISSTQFQIKLNKTATSNLYVAWMVLG